MQVTLPNKALPITLRLGPQFHMSDDEYFDFCMAHRNLRFERTAQGEIVIVPPAGLESSYQSGDAFEQLARWAKRGRHGKVFDASAEFILPTRAALSPDAAWVSNRRLSALSKDQKRKFPPVCPEFVIEVMSPSDRLRAAKEKMEEWIRAGVDLAWLIHGDVKTVYVYRAGQKGGETLSGINKISGEGPVAGFKLDLTGIWAGL